MLELTVLSSPLIGSNVNRSNNPILCTMANLTSPPGPKSLSVACNVVIKWFGGGFSISIPAQVDLSNTGRWLLVVPIPITTLTVLSLKQLASLADTISVC